VIGPRRAGKTYFIYNIIKNLISEGIPKERMIYINLEDERLLPLEVKDMDLFLRTFFEIHSDDKNEEIHLFLDEVQNVDNWETFVRRIMDTYNIQVYITGSSSKLLSKEIATSLRGRSLSTTILPFSFREYLKAGELEISKFLSSSKKDKIRSKLSIFLKFGSFPEITLEKDNDLMHKIIKEYVEVMLIQDIIERYNIKNTKLLKILFDGIISSTSSTFSIHKFFKFLRSQGMKISKNTLYQYVQYLEDAYAIIILRSFNF
jgi:predicted AAA+ superfamily ATPase